MRKSTRISKIPISDRSLLNGSDLNRNDAAESIVIFNANILSLPNNKKIGIEVKIKSIETKLSTNLNKTEVLCTQKDWALSCLKLDSEVVKGARYRKRNQIIDVGTLSQDNSQIDPLSKNQMCNGLLKFTLFQLLPLFNQQSKSRQVTPAVLNSARANIERAIAKSSCCDRVLLSAATNLYLEIQQNLKITI